MKSDELRGAPTAWEMDNDPNSRMDYGTKRHSGRFPWGSGKDPYQRMEGRASFLGRVRELKKNMSEIEVAKAMGFKTTDQLRKAINQADEQVKQYYYSEAYRLKQKGLSNVAIGERLGKNESTIRGYLDEARRERMDATRHNADILKEAVENSGYIDVGQGVEKHLGISQTKLNNAVALLQKEGYEVHPIKQKQQSGYGYTTVAVLTKPDTDERDIYANRDKIRPPFPAFSEDGDRMTLIRTPVSVDPNRVSVRYSEDGGTDKDGIIEIRRGVEDLSLGNAKYVQARIAVGGTHYLKGMAVYSDNLPDGVDILFNTNKHKGTPMMGPKDNSVLKPLGDDPENPFGASIKPDEKLIRAQRYFTDKNGERQLSPINVVNEEGDWNNWDRNLSSQFLSKQSPALAKQQLKLAYDISKNEYDDIMKLTNPTVKRMLLDEFAGACESDSVHLSAAALPRQATKVILPVKSLKENEIYAPGYNDGEEVVLVRYPHAGPFESPRLIVNNRNKEASSFMENAIDAVGINHKAAEQLSGADFDGDSVLVLPTKNVNIRTNKPLQGLEGFDPKAEYKAYPGMHRMTKQEKGMEMGRVSNLITDMTILGAPIDEIERAVKHSMVVIDAEKHNLDYRRSEQENGIPELRKKWLGRSDAGASTLISKASSDLRIPQRKEKLVSNMTSEELARWKNGEMVYEDTGRQYAKAKLYKRDMTPEEKAVWGSSDAKIDRYLRDEERAAWEKGDPSVRKRIMSKAILRVAREEGRTTSTIQDRLEKTTKLAVETDAYNLVSGSRNATTRIESIYADYSNAMKDLARMARKESRALNDIEYQSSAAKVYAPEVASLNAKLNVALSNAPLERMAQLMAGSVMSAKKYADPGMDNEHEKRMRARELDKARKKVGAKKISINITDREWEAINAGAITKTKLRDILNNSDKDRVKSLATPRTRTGMSPARIARAKSMLSRGYSQADVADMLGVSVSTLVSSIGVKDFATD